MAIVAAARTRRAGALFSPAGLAIAVVLVLLLLFTLLDLSPATSSGSGGSGSSGSSGGTSRAASSAGGTSSAAAQIPAYAGVPEFGISMNLPTWALCPQPPCQYSAMADGPVNTSVPFNSQFGEDVWLSKYLFHNKVNGFYIEMGAMNGVDLSNTRWLYQAAGWKGMLIEACPGMYGDLQQNRRDAITVHAAACGEFRTVHWHSAGNVGGIYEFMAEGFKEQFHRDLKPETLPEVPCVPFQFLLDKFGIGSVDLWSLDVEGAELEVLKTVDLGRFQAKVIMVELDGHNKEKDDAVIKLLMAAGYEVLKKTGEMSFEMKHFNTIFVHKSAWSFLAHAPDLAQPEIEADPLNVPPQR